MMVDIWKLSDLCTPWCVHVVATLRIAQHIEAGKTQISELAAASGADSEYLARVLRHLVSQGVFEEPESGRFELNESARMLLEPSLLLGLDLDSFGGRMAHSWSSLLQAVKTGEPAYHTVFGKPFWDDLAAHPDLRASFDELMGAAGHGIPDPDVLVSGDWESVRTVVDVGGGNGTLLAEILRSRPNLRGILVDLPEAIVKSPAIFQGAGVADRVTTSPQSFFDRLPGGADLYVLKSVLSDWPDREAELILARCAEAAKPGGRVVLLNGVSPDDSSGPPPEILMMVLVGGKGRTMTEFRELAARAGLQLTTSGRQPSGRFIVECRPIL